MYFILTYKTVDNYIELRTPFRRAHLALALKAHQDGQLIMAGALEEPADAALLIFKGENATVAENFAKSDPYVINGLISEWKVRAWNVVIGA